MQYEDVLTCFSVDKRTATTAQCKCPAHDDGKASLTVSKGEKGVVVHCHAGCDTDSVLSAVGLKKSDLFYDNAKSTTKYDNEKWKQYLEEKNKKKIEAVYHFTDIAGRYVYTKVRLTGKDMKIGILNGDKFKLGLNGKSKAELKGVYKDAERVRNAIAAGERVFYCEGEKDVDTMLLHGYAAITAGGVNDWQKEFAEIFRGGDVIVLSDNDNAGVTSSRQIVRDLHGIAKSARFIIPTPDIPKGDISDYFINHGIADFEILLQNGQDTDVNETVNNLDQFHIVADNGRITGVFDWKIFEHIRNTENIFVIGGTPFIYADGVYIADESGARLKTMIRSLIYPKFIKSGTLKRIYELFLSDLELQVSFDDINNYPSYWINFKNGFYDPKTRCMIQHSPEYRSINQLPCSYNVNDTPKGEAIEAWLRFIVPEQDDREMLLQYVGYCLTTDVSQQKFMILNGEGGSGKSTLIRMIEELIGAENISNISLTELTQRFASYGLMGKLLNSCADLEISALEDTSTLKKCLGEDRLRGEQKGHDAVSFKSHAKMIFSTNELPIVKAERTNGFYRRLLILTMNKVPKNGRSDFFLSLRSEIDYFLHLSVEALSRMYERGNIVESAASIKAINQMKCDSDTVEAWLQERAYGCIGSEIDRARCYQNYNEYCNENERQSLSRTNFYKAMRSKGYAEHRTAAGRFICDISFSKPVTDSVTNDEQFVMDTDKYDNPFE